MFGSEFSQYVRSRNLRAMPGLYIYHAGYALEVAAECWNVLGRVELDVVYGAGREDEPNFEDECRAWVASKEASHPCYEVSWMGEATIDGRKSNRRLYRGFTSRDEARAFYKSEPGEYCRLIDMRSGERIDAPCLV